MIKEKEKEKEKEKYNLALLNKCDLVKIIHEQREKIEVLEAVLAPGWGKWKFEKTEESVKIELLNKTTKS